MITLEKARSAKLKLKNLLMGKKWLRGIGITYDTEYIVMMNVGIPTSEIAEQVPEVVDGVRVSIREIDNISIHESSNFIPGDG